MSIHDLLAFFRKPVIIDPPSPVDDWWQKRAQYKAEHEETS